jgi:hypothetical protein
MYNWTHFCEYKTTEFQIGRWTDGLSPNYIPTFNRKDYTNFKDKCKTCVSKDTCGLKYLFAIFNRDPAMQCETFYKIVDTMVNYVAKLNSKPNFLTWINDGNR